MNVIMGNSRTQMIIKDFRNILGGSGTGGISAGLFSIGFAFTGSIWTAWIGSSG